MSVRFLLVAASGILASLPAFSESLEHCFVGNYHLEDRSDVDISPSVDGTLRWRKFDGTTGALHPQANGTWTSTRGWTKAADGMVVSFAGCDGNAIRFGGIAGTRTDFDVHEITFESHGTRLVGRLVLPRGEAKVPIVVLVHGSEHDSALTSYSLQRMLPAQGIGAFVYDKRGTGKSGGTYTQDYSLLAYDAVAAATTTRSFAGARLGSIGFQGGSQAGWVVPLAASRTAVDFAIVGFGLAVNAIDEDQQSVELQLSEKGYSRGEIRDALKVARAAEKVIASGFSNGFAELDRLRSRYSGARWYKDLRGDYTYLILPRSEAELRIMAPEFDWHTPWNYDPMPVLRSSRTPQLWILGGEDYDAPSRETRKRLQSLIAEGRDYTVAYYKNAEHGITLFEVDATGERISTRYAPGYFQLIRDFALHGTVSGQYGDAELTRPLRHD
ncbi:alpha/beta hydrolase [Dokdonella soli]|uniref:alpha/beta hydrolase family protein n=1 Tax=Dokdonella soli TaxID=529810 RepID=UPI0031D5FCE5